MSPLKLRTLVCATFAPLALATLFVVGGRSAVAQERPSASPPPERSELARKRDALIGRLSELEGKADSIVEEKRASLRRVEAAAERAFNRVRERAEAASRRREERRASRNEDRADTRERAALSEPDTARDAADRAALDAGQQAMEAEKPVQIQ